MEKKTKKILLLSGLLVALGGVAWYLLFYKPSATTTAKALGLYTGDPLLDGALDNMIAACMISSGAIKDGNLEWELTDAKNRMLTPMSTSEDYWRINGDLTAAGALLATIDSTHDWKNSVDGSGNLYIPQIDLNKLWDIFNDTKSAAE